VTLPVRGNAQEEGPCGIAPAGEITVGTIFRGLASSHIVPYIPIGSRPMSRWRIHLVGVADLTSSHVGTGVFAYLEPP
jgi:hypothetical protein